MARERCKTTASKHNVFKVTHLRHGRQSVIHKQMKHQIQTYLLYRLQTETDHHGQ